MGQVHPPVLFRLGRVGSGRVRSNNVVDRVWVIPDDAECYAKCSCKVYICGNDLKTILCRNRELVVVRSHFLALFRKIGPSLQSFSLFIARCTACRPSVCL